MAVKLFVFCIAFTSNLLFGAEEKNTFQGKVTFLVNETVDKKALRALKICLRSSSSSSGSCKTKKWKPYRRNHTI